MKNDSSLVQIVQSLYAAFGRGDIPTILAGLSDDVQWGLNVDPTAPGVAAVPSFRLFSGRADVGNFFSAISRDLEFHTFAPQSFAAGPHEVVSRVVVDTTVLSTGRRVRVESLHHFTFDAANKVSRFREFTDTLSFAIAWGKVKAA